MDFRLKTFKSAIASMVILTGVIAPISTSAESWQDAFTADELDLLFGGAEEIPGMIGPHRVVMSMEEAASVQGEIPPIVIVGVVGIGAVTGGGAAWLSGGSGYDIAVGSVAGGSGALLGLFGGAGFGVLGGAVGTAYGTLGTTYGCMNCHQAN